MEICVSVVNCRTRVLRCPVATLILFALLKSDLTWSWKGQVWLDSLRTCPQTQWDPVSINHSEVIGFGTECLDLTAYPTEYPPARTWSLVPFSRQDPPSQSRLIILTPGSRTGIHPICERSNAIVCRARDLQVNLVNSASLPQSPESCALSSDWVNENKDSVPQICTHLGSTACRGIPASKMYKIIGLRTGI
jgi:hypothetical protein